MNMCGILGVNTCGWVGGDRPTLLGEDCQVCVGRGRPTCSWERVCVWRGQAPPLLAAKLPLRPQITLTVPPPPTVHAAAPQL